VAASGIGRAIAGRFAAEGCGVVLAGVEQAALDRATGSYGTTAD
jgi:NAD(P)-dependent dehydrogenase (short-subunit alcohol dehydrogenase family)